MSRRCEVRRSSRTVYCVAIQADYAVQTECIPCRGGVRVNEGCD